MPTPLRQEATPCTAADTFQSRQLRCSARCRKDLNFPIYWILLDGIERSLITKRDSRPSASLVLVVSIRMEVATCSTSTQHHCLVPKAVVRYKQAKCWRPSVLRESRTFRRYCNRQHACRVTARALLERDGGAGEFQTIFSVITEARNRQASCLHGLLRTA